MRNGIPHFGWIRSWNCRIAHAQNLCKQETGTAFRSLSLRPPQRWELGEVFFVLIRIWFVLWSNIYSPYWVFLYIMWLLQPYSPTILRWLCHRHQDYGKSLVGQFIINHHHQHDDDDHVQFISSSSSFMSLTLSHCLHFLSPGHSHTCCHNHSLTTHLTYLYLMCLSFTLEVRISRS